LTVPNGADFRTVRALPILEPGHALWWKSSYAFHVRETFFRSIFNTRIPIITSVNVSASMSDGLIKDPPVIELSDDESGVGCNDASEQKLDDEDGGDDWEDFDTDSYLCEIMNGEDDVDDFDGNGTEPLEFRT